MQTIKTAVVVVLLMTVLYGAYVSLTTPPPELPPDVAQLIEDEGLDFTTDAGMPAGLGGFAINDGEPAGFDAAQPPAFGAGVSVPESDATGHQHGSISTTLSDQFSPDASDDATVVASGGPAADEQPRTLPKPPADAVAVAADPTRDYPTTDQAAFSLPDPASITGELGMDSGNNAFTPPETPLNLPSAADGGVSASMSDAAATASKADAAPAAADGTSPRSAGNVGLANALAAADRQVEADRLKEALATLSLFYHSPDLSDQERQQLLQRIDPLAGEVVYSPQHLLEQPHRVGQNETLMEIAARYEVPWQLLANINGIDDPVVVLPGTELKVVRGPFRAEVNLSSSELTLFLGDLYAGRFPIRTGTDPAPQPGTYTVQDKQSSRTYYGAAGNQIPPGDPRNPYGQVWLDLGKQMCIHGSPTSGDASAAACIALQAEDADDVYGILSQGSSVTIRR